MDDTRFKSDIEKSFKCFGVSVLEELEEKASYVFNLISEIDDDDDLESSIAKHVDEFGNFVRISVDCTLEVFTGNNEVIRLVGNLIPQICHHPFFPWKRASWDNSHARLC